MTAKATFSRPSQLVGIQDELAAYLLDKATAVFGLTVENALMERSDPDDKGTTRPIYTLAQLLAPGFRLPRPDHEPLELPGIDGVLYDEVR